MTYLGAASKAQQAANWAGTATGGTDQQKATNLAWAVRDLALAVKELSEQMHRDSH